MMKDRRILQAGLGIFVCLDCLRVKKTLDHELCNPCSSDKRWESSRKQNEEFADWCQSQHHQAGLGTNRCLDCLELKKKFGTERCRNCAASVAQKKIFLRPERHQKAREVMLGKQNALGHRLSDEAKAKIGITKVGNKNMLGHCHSEKSKRLMSLHKAGTGFLGHRHKKESLEKMSVALVGNKHLLGYRHSEKTLKKISGSNASNWQDGKSFEPYSIDWRGSLKAMIRDRDSHRCQICGASENGKKHDIHHIDYNKKNCHPDNLTTLCNTDNNCHGTTNYHRWYWPEHFKWLAGQKEADIALGVQRGW